MNTTYLLRNLTPHQLDFLGRDGALRMSIPPDPQGPARVAVSQRTIAHVDLVMDPTDVGDPLLTLRDYLVVAQAFGTVENLPMYQEGVLLIVSQIVAQAAPERGDLVFPTNLLRNREGAVVGCQALGTMATT